MFFFHRSASVVPKRVVDLTPVAALATQRIEAGDEAMQPYDESNIFARILKGELPAHRVLDDDAALAFMDVMPRVEGHVLVVPKRAARTLLDIDADALALLMPRVQRVGRAVVRAFDADGLTLQQFNEQAGGQVVFHLHFHLLPRHEGVSLQPPGGPMANPEVLAAHAARIRAALEP